jgi:hypothetical protein
MFQIEAFTAPGISHTNSRDAAVGNGINRIPRRLERAQVDAGVEMIGAKLLERRTVTVIEIQGPAVFFLGVFILGLAPGQKAEKKKWYQDFVFHKPGILTLFSG